jgi:NDP-sugar pyrophosphorylase family protein
MTRDGARALDTTDVARAYDTAIILVGGRGTRLGALSAAVPKPMLPVAGRPFVEYLVYQLRRSGIRTIIFACGYRTEVVRTYFGDGRRWDIGMVFSEEPEPLGTGGALRLASERVEGERFLAMNGDSFLAVDPREVAAGEPEETASMALVTVTDTGRYGNVERSPDGMVTRFAQGGRSGEPGLVNAGIYAFRRDAMLFIPPGRPCSLEHEVLPRLAGRGLRGVPFDAFFVDIGLPDTYDQLRGHPEPLLDSLGLSPELPLGLPPAS